MVFLFTYLETFASQRLSYFVFQFGLTPLHVAAFAGHVTVVECLLRHEADPDCRADPMTSRLTALHLAAAAGRSDVIRTLIGANADVDAVAGVTSPFDKM